MTERLDLTASRNETWRPTIDYVYGGAALPLTGATARMQWRLYEGAAGSALIDLVDVPYEDDPATADDIAQGWAREGDRILRLSPTIAVAALAGLPTGLNQPEPGEADRYTWDIVITYSDGLQDRLLAGFVLLDKGTTSAA